MPIASVLILAREDALAEELAAPLDSGGFAVTRKSSLDHLESMGDEQAPDLVLLDWGLASIDETHALVEQCRALQVPCILILSYGDLASFDVSRSSSDLLLTPIQPQELLTRVRLLLRHAKGVASHSIVRVGDLTNGLLALAPAPATPWFRRLRRKEWIGTPAVQEPHRV